MRPQSDPRELPEWLQREVEEIATAARLRRRHRRTVGLLALSSLLVAALAASGGVVRWFTP